MKYTDVELKERKIPNLTINHTSITDPQGRKAQIISSVEVKMPDGQTVEVLLGGNEEFLTNEEVAIVEGANYQKVATLRVDVK